jgi:hypothetical protein
VTRNGKFAVFLALAIVGGIAIALSTLAVIGPLHHGAPSTPRIVAATLIIAIAMGWTCIFATRAHFARDEFKRQREISAYYWGGWFGIAASTPIFFFIALGGLGRLAGVHMQPLGAFASGYMLPPICAFLGGVAARIWLRHRDSRQ